MILGVRTDKPEAELYLYDSHSYKKQHTITWEAHRQLSDTLILRIEELLKDARIQQADVTAIIVYQGPGSFTGLRIGISIANALAYTSGIPIAAAEGEDWQHRAFESLQSAPQQKPIIPAYGAEANITAPRK